MDPSKRICLKNIPPDCTKREIAEFIRNRTGAQPHSIDLGLDEDGRPRRYAHFSAEGAKNIVPVLTGAAWRSSTVTALHATPHYTHRLAEARRRREAAEQTAAEERAAHWKYCTEKWLAKTGGGLTAGRVPKSFYATRQRYAAVAAEIARKLREEHKNRRHTQNGQAVRNYHHHWGGEENKKEEQGRGTLSATEKVGGSEGCRPRIADRTTSNQHYKHPRSKGVVSAKGAKRPKTESTNTNTTAERRGKEEEKPPVPSKEERKLSGLQAKLAALRAKMK